MVRSVSSLAIPLKIPAATVCQLLQRHTLLFADLFGLFAPSPFSSFVSIAAHHNSNITVPSLVMQASASRVESRR